MKFFSFHECGHEQVLIGKGRFCKSWFVSVNPNEKFRSFAILFQVIIYGRKVLEFTNSIVSSADIFRSLISNGFKFIECWWIDCTQSNPRCQFVC